MYRAFSPKKLREYRQKRQLTATTVCERSSGVLTPSDICNYERGLSKPKTLKLAALLTGLGCKWDAISEPVDLSALFQDAINGKPVVSRSST